MGYMIEIETKDVQHASDYAEKALKYMGKVMQCISSWEDESGMGERSGSYGGRYGGRGGYGSRGSMGYRDDEDWEDMDERYEDMGERRGRRRRDSRGRYM